MRCLHCNTEYDVAQEGGSEKKRGCMVLLDMSS